MYGRIVDRQMFVIQKKHSAVGAAAPAIEGRGADRLGVMISPLFFELRSFSLVDSSVSHATLSSMHPTLHLLRVGLVI